MVRQHHIQLVHLHGSSHDLSFFANCLALIAARAGGARTVWHLHQDLAVVEFPGTGALTRTAFRAAMRVPDAVAILTEKDRRIAAALVSPEKLVILPPSCSADLLDIPPRSAHGTIRVLYVGWLTQAKGIHDLLRVALAVRDDAPQIKFDVMGTDRATGEGQLVRSFIDRHGLQAQVTLRGSAVGEAKRRLFAEADLLLMPTHRDAFPVAVLEAMAAGLPVLATNVGGLPYMLEDGHGARLVDVGDVTGFARHLADLARDDRLRAAMGRTNRERFVARYHPDRAGEAAVDLYERLVRSP